MAQEPKRGIELTGVKASTGHVDYYSVLTAVIDLVLKDPAQMRSLIYELARMTLRREAWNKFPPLRGEELKAQVNKLEEAISRVELDQQTAKLADYTPPTRISDDRDKVRPRELVMVSERPSLTQATRVFNVAETKPGFWSRFGNPRDQRMGFNLVSMLQLVVASFIGVAMFAFMTGQFEFGRTKRAPETPAAQPVPTAAPAVQATAPAVQAATPPTSALSFAPPPNYGVYALNNGKLVELDRMPMRMPDPRVILSPEISMPVRVTLPNGKPTFVIYRRDLVAASQDRVPARVVARIARELTFKNGMAVTNSLKGIWRVRNISYDLRVASVGDKGDMISVAPDASMELPAGRYALVLNGLGYDFSIAGKVTSPQQCLEKTETTEAAVYTDCKNP